jgi:hypothetical protein
VSGDKRQAFDFCYHFEYILYIVLPCHLSLSNFDPNCKISSLCHMYVYINLHLEENEQLGEFLHQGFFIFHQEVFLLCRWGEGDKVLLREAFSDRWEFD